MSGLSIPILSLAVMIGVTDLLAPFQDGASREAHKGGQRYAARDWEGAMEHYEKAGAARPDGALQYNLGTAAYRKNDYRAATQALSRAMADTKLDRDRAAYNLGNTRFKAGDLQGALGAYRAALCANPNDADARQNYELALRQLKSSPPDSSRQNDQQNEKNQDNAQNQSQQDQSNPDQNGSQNKNQEQQDQSQSQQAGQEGPEDKKEDSQNQARNEPKEGQESKADSTGNAPARPGQMTPAEAKRLLNAVTPEERELLQARLKATRKHRAEKDW